MAAPPASRRPERTSGGGAGDGWRARAELTTPSLCWEFLRRNPGYREDFRRAAQSGAMVDRRWGLAARADPDLSADEAEVIWREDVAPGLVVPMERAAIGRPRTLPRGAQGAVEAPEGRHIRLPSGLQLLLRGGAAPAEPLVVVLSFDEDFNLRVRAVDALRRASLTAAPPKSRLTSVQKEKLARALFALDAAAAGRSHREIATELFGAEAFGDEPFGVSTIRDVTARLIRRGRALMSGGYLKLLRAGF